MAERDWGLAPALKADVGHAMTANTRSIRDEARLFAWADLYPEQQTQLRDGIALISAILRRGDEVQKSKTRQPPRREAQGLASIDDVRLNTTILIEGDRGVGKTTLLLHLLAYARRSRLGESLTDPVAGSTAPFMPAKREEFAMIEKWAGRVVPLEILDLERLPAGRHPVHAIAQRLRSVIPDDEFEKDGSPVVDAWFAFAQAAAIGIDSQGRHTETTLDQIPYELEREAKEHLHIGPAWQRLVKEIVRMQTDGSLEPLLLIPIDDADLAHEHIGNVMETLRWLSHPRVSFIVGGTHWLFEERETVRLSEDLKAKSDDHGRIRGLAQKAIQKAFPAGQHINVTPISAGPAVRAMASVRLRSGQSMGQLLEAYPSLQVGVSFSARDIADGLKSDTDPSAIVAGWRVQNGLNLIDGGSYITQYGGSAVSVESLAVLTDPSLSLSLHGRHLDERQSAVAAIAALVGAEHGFTATPIQPSALNAGLVRFRDGQNSWAWPAPVLTVGGHERLRALWRTGMKALPTDATAADVVTLYLRVLADLIGLESRTRDPFELMGLLRYAEVEPGPDRWRLQEWRDHLPLITLPEGGLPHTIATRLFYAWGLLSEQERKDLRGHRRALLGGGDNDAWLARLPSSFPLDSLFPDRLDEQLVELLNVRIASPVDGPHFPLTFGKIAIVPGFLSGPQKQGLIDACLPARQRLKALSLSGSAAFTTARLVLGTGVSKGVFLSDESPSELAQNITSVLGTAAHLPPGTAKEPVREDGSRFRVVHFQRKHVRDEFQISVAESAKLLLVQAALVDAIDGDLSGTTLPIQGAGYCRWATGKSSKASEIRIGLPAPRFPSALDHAILSEWWEYYVSVLNGSVSAGMTNIADNAMRAWIGLIVYIAGGRDLGSPSLRFNSLDIAPIEGPPKVGDWDAILEKADALAQAYEKRKDHGARGRSVIAWLKHIPLLAAPEFGASSAFSQTLIEDLLKRQALWIAPRDIADLRVKWLQECGVADPEAFLRARRESNPTHPFVRIIEAGSQGG